jgi:hypothetical protein
MPRGIARRDSKCSDGGCNLSCRHAKGEKLARRFESLELGIQEFFDGGVVEIARFPTKGGQNS